MAHVAGLKRKRIAIVGGGITGLTTAFHLQESMRGAVDLTLIESTPRWGGKIVSVQERGFIVEGGPDSFSTQKTAALDMCRALGLDDLRIGSNGAARSAYVWSRGRLHPLPEGMMAMAPAMIRPFLRSRLISLPGKLRMGMEIFVPRPAQDRDESLGSFVRRRFGAEALDKIAGPLLAGIHAADPERLSLRSTFPVFPDMEKKHGSLLRGMMVKGRVRPAQGAQGGSASMFTTFQGGLQQLSDAIAARIDPQSLRPNCRVLTVFPDGAQYKVALSDGSCIPADDIVFATPADATADLLQSIDPLLASKLRAIRYVSTATVSLGFKRSDLPPRPAGSGFLVSAREKRQITACSWSSEKFSHRAPEDCALLRIFVGGARAENLAEQSETALVDLARRELRATMGITAAPVLAQVYCWRKSIPQYEVGHQARIAEIDRIASERRGLYLAGAAYHGAGIPDCMQDADRAAQAIAGKYGMSIRRAV